MAVSWAVPYPWLYSSSALSGFVLRNAAAQPFWACAWLALVIGLFFARKKEDYCLAAMRGIGDENGIVIITAWLFAGVFGQLMAAGGLVDGLLWMGMSTGAQGSIFVGLVFFASMLFALGTGTSTGTCIALTPVLYPAGYFLGADPAMLGLAILSGAAFGDNLSPIADTTIVSAYTQGATMKEVVRSRFPLSMSAAVMAMVIFLIFGNADQAAALPDIQKDFDPAGVLMLIALVVVVGSAMMGPPHHRIPGLRQCLRGCHRCAYRPYQADANLRYPCPGRSVHRLY